MFNYSGDQKRRFVFSKNVLMLYVFITYILTF